MNDRDRNNVNFIMNLSTEDFDSWSLELSDDNLQYALELLRQARLENLMQEQELMDALEESDFVEANSVLKKFML